MTAPRRRLLGYTLSLLALASAVFIRWLLGPVVGERVPFATLLGAVAVAVGFGGLYPALLVTVAGYVAGRLLFLEPTRTLALTSVADWITLAGYLFACFTVILFGLLMRRANRRQARTAAELADLNQRKDRLLATVAHELRNPLAPIRNAVTVLRNQAGSRTREISLAQDMIDRQLDHLTRLIDDLVDMDRIARNQLELRTASVSLTAVLEVVVDRLRPTITNQHQQLIVRMPKERLMLEGDSARLEQVFVNLLTNACKFTPPEGKIEMEVQSENGHAIVQVTDTGIGIAEETMPRIFEMFYQADRKQRGLGIGLALVRQLVEMHGGTVSGRSDGLGKGSEFVVRLPLAADSPALRFSADESGIPSGHPSKAPDGVEQPITG